MHKHMDFFNIKWPSKQDWSRGKINDDQWNTGEKNAARLKMEGTGPKIHCHLKIGTWPQGAVLSVRQHLVPTVSSSYGLLWLWELSVPSVTKSCCCVDPAPLPPQAWLPLCLGTGSAYVPVAGLQPVLSWVQHTDGCWREPSTRGFSRLGALCTQARCRCKILTPMSHILKIGTKDKDALQQLLSSALEITNGTRISQQTIRFIILYSVSSTWRSAP